MLIGIIISFLFMGLVGLFFYRQRKDELAGEMIWNVFKGTWFISPVFGTLSTLALSEVAMNSIQEGNFFSAINNGMWRSWFLLGPILFTLIFLILYFVFLKQWWIRPGITPENIHKIPARIAKAGALLLTVAFSLGFIANLQGYIQEGREIKFMAAATPVHFLSTAYFTLVLIYVSAEKIVRTHTELNYGSLKTRLYINTVVPLAFSIIYMIDAAYLIDISSNPTHIKFLRLGCAFVMLFSVFTYSIYVSLSLLLKPVNQLTDALESISSGERDLTKRLYIETRDDLGNLSVFFNRFLSQVYDIVKSIASTANQVNDSSKSLVESSQSTTSATREISASVDRESQSLESVNDQVTRMDSASAEIAENATTTTQRSKEMEHLVERGVESMGNMVNSMDLINDSTQKIGGILGEIRGIAKQTNLLSLNAAIEAAKAGEHGKGFAVVAQHVRELAERSTNATVNIQALIKESAERVKEGNVAVEEVQKILVEVSDLVHASTESVEQITHAASEQSAFVHEVFIEITLLRELAKTNAESTSRIMESMESQNQAVQTLGKDAEILLDTVAQFKT